jgi:MOSC domain-containing protein YiiM
VTAAVGRNVMHIFVAQSRGAPMRSITSVDAVTGQGLIGDRYYQRAIRRGPDYQVSLIEAEAIEQFTKELGLAMTADMPRRNIVTTGVRLNDLLGKRFIVGNVLLEGLELCEPCSLFAKRTYPQVLSFFKGRGGLRASIVESGTIRIGDPLRPAGPE